MGDMLATDDGRIKRTMIIMVDVPVYRQIRRLKYQRQTTYSEVIENALRLAYGPPTDDDRKDTE